MPQLVLRNFTDKAGDLYEFDLDTLKVLKKKTGGVAHEPDFYTTDVDGQPSDEVEDILGGIETRSAMALKKLEVAGTRITNDDLDALVMLVALQRQRTPSAREPMINFLNRTEDMARAMVSSQGLDEQEAMADLLRKHEAVRGRNFMNTLMLSSLAPIYRLMRRRGWSLMWREEGAPKFVISDNPVVITDLREDTGPPYSPLIPYGLDSRIAMPISPDVTLVLYDEPVFMEGTIPFFVVEHLNNQQLQQARRRVYGSEGNFSIGRIEEQIVDWSRWVEDQKEVRAEQGWKPSFR